MFPLNRVFDSRDWFYDWRDHWRANGEDVSDLERDFDRGVIDRIARYKMPHFAFKTAREKLGIDPRHSFHSLRYSAATHLLERGADIEVIRDALGHRSADTTRGYTLAP